jgi:RNA polymerase sigma factor (sigma-70 family)
MRFVLAGLGRWTPGGCVTESSKGVTDSTRLPADFEAFFTQEQQRFLTLATSRLRDRRDAEEAVLEAWRRIYVKWPRMLSHAKPIALAYRILDGVITDYYRRIARYGSRELPVAEPYDPAYFQELRAHEELDLAMEALHASDPRLAMCVEMRHLLELSYREIADRLDITPGTARVHVCNGLKRLREIMTGPQESKGGTW